MVAVPPPCDSGSSAGTASAVVEAASAMRDESLATDGVDAHGCTVGRLRKDGGAKAMAVGQRAAQPTSATGRINLMTMANSMSMKLCVIICDVSSAVEVGSSFSHQELYRKVYEVGIREFLMPLALSDGGQATYIRQASHLVAANLLGKTKNSNFIF